MRLHPVLELTLLGALMFAVMFIGKADAQGDDIRVCRDMRTYPEKIVIVCGGCQCPAGYH